MEKQTILATFLEIVHEQSTTETARQILEATNWNLEEAIQLFYVRNEIGGSTSSSQAEYNPTLLPDQNFATGWDSDTELKNDGSEEVHPTIPVIRETLYDHDDMYRDLTMRYTSNERREHVEVWESEQSVSSTTDNSQIDLASMYCPPFELMHRGSFDNAKLAASTKDRWLLVNLQSTKEFSSHMLNRDTWAHEATAQIIRNNFIFWQDYNHTREGRRVCSFYNLDSFPVVLLIDPITGQKIHHWSGMIQPERLMEDLVPFMDRSPKDYVPLHHKSTRESSHASAINVQDETIGEDEQMVMALTASIENLHVGPTPINENGSTYPPLPEEPKVDRSLLCRVGLRLPDGSRVQRNFLRTDPIQLLWSFCSSQLKEEGETRPFCLTQAIPGASKFLDYESKLGFEESGLANSLISVIWE